MFRRGYLELFRLRGAPVRAHWTVVLGALLFSGFAFAPVAWLAFFTVILVHELGHALLVRRYGHRVSAIELTGFGGLCRWSGDATADERAAIAWGGVLAQAALFLVTLLPVLALGIPRGPLGELVYVFLRTNAWLIAINLLPIPPLDGAEAWGLLSRWAKRRLRAPEMPSFSGWRRDPPRAEPGPRISVRPVAPRPAPPSSAPPRASRDVADALRRIGEDARQARRS